MKTKGFSDSRSGTSV